MTGWMRRVTLITLFSVAGLLALLFWWWRRLRFEEEAILTTDAGTVTRVRVPTRPAPRKTAEGTVRPAPIGKTQVGDRLLRVGQNGPSGEAPRRLTRMCE